MIIPFIVHVSKYDDEKFENEIYIQILIGSMFYHYSNRHVYIFQYERKIQSIHFVFTVLMSAMMARGFRVLPSLDARLTLGQFSPVRGLLQE